MRVSLWSTTRIGSVFSVRPLAKEGFDMSARTKNDSLRSLQLPDPFEDLTGLIGSDLKVIARALAERASHRLLLPPRQARQLERKLWNNMTRVINETVGSLTVERH
jgi:hypothetical protein